MEGPGGSRRDVPGQDARDVRHARFEGPGPLGGLGQLGAGRRWRYGKGRGRAGTGRRRARRSEEHTSELQSLMRISYAVFCLKKKNKHKEVHTKTKKHYQLTQQQTEHQTTNINTD